MITLDLELSPTPTWSMGLTQNDTAIDLWPPAMTSRTWQDFSVSFRPEHLDRAPEWLAMAQAILHSPEGQLIADRMATIASALKATPRGNSPRSTRADWGTIIDSMR